MPSKIGYNPQDRFMMTLGNTLVVVARDGGVFGADVVNDELQPVFEFGGAKIGFNPQDRFMMTLGNTLVVVTREGNVFGSDVVNRQLQPVFQFAGAKIGFNPQDRFMFALGNTLVVVTRDGNVFSADVVGKGDGRFLAPIQQFSGAKIGFNPQDRFMMTVGSTLVVVTADGSVFGSDVKSTPTGAAIGIAADGSKLGPIMRRDLLPVFQFGGARIGFNDQDRFMMALGETLVVVTNEGDVYGADAQARSLSEVRRLNPVPLPARLQFRLRGFVEHDSNDDLLQGASDEVWISAIGADSSRVVVGANGNPVANTTAGQPIGDVTEDAVRNPWQAHPYALMEFDLRGPSDWPRSFVTTLLMVEHDNADLAKVFDDLEREVGTTIKKAAESAATAAAGAVIGTLVGTAIIPGIGTAVGAAVGSLAGLAYDVIIKEIAQGLGDDVFTPRAFELLVTDPGTIRQHPLIGSPQSIQIHELDAEYTISYDWFLVE